MNAVFADTFFWIAFINPVDRHAEEALRFDELLSEGLVYTTEEVLAELLTFFAGDVWLRRRAVETVREILADGVVRVLPQSHDSFQSGSIFMPRGRTRATASQIAFRCRSRDVRNSPRS